MKHAARVTLLIPILALPLLLAACRSEAPPASEPPPPEVGVVEIEARPLTLTTDLPGRTAAYRVAEVRPQVNGIVQRRLFDEGQTVEAGDQLYQIDDAKYRAAYDRARATLSNAERLAKRYAGLMKTGAISRQQHDDAQAAWELAKAELELARIDLVYTRVLAPIAGRIGRSAVTEGALVTSGQAEALATIQQIDPIYVDMTQPVEQVLALRADLAAGRIDGLDAQRAKVKLLLEGRRQYPLDGTLEVSEVSVDPGTGSVTLRAVFPNPDGLLLPGMFVHARLSEGVRQEAILVPQQAIVRDSRGEPMTWVVTEAGTVESRAVTTERTVGNHWLVSEGVRPGERVVTEGVERLRPGMQVTTAPAANVRPVLDFVAARERPAADR